MTDIYPHHVNRTIEIGALPEVVFRYFTDSTRWAAWWGRGSAIDARIGGAILIRHPNGVEVVGEVLELRPPEHIAFTYGYPSGSPIAPGASRVTIRLEPLSDGTRLHLQHDFVDTTAADHHVQGWRYQLSLFGNVVADEVHADAAAVADRWFSLWSNPNEQERNAALDLLVEPSVVMRDRFSLISGAADMRAHLAAIHRFMPGMTLERQGDVRHCQGVVLADWVAKSSDGGVRARGTNVFTLNARNHIASVTGLWLG